jgi:hypothetical protein
VLTGLSARGIVPYVSARDWRIASVLFVLISSVYFATVAGITSSNDGSHYALVRAMVDKHSFEISEYLDYTEHQDYAFKGDLKFSDRPPGTAFLAAPLYAASAFLPKPWVSVPSKHDPDNPRLIYVLVVPVLAASLTAVILFYLLRVQFGLSEGVGVLTTLAFAFGTMTWKYGSLLYSHATSGLIVMGAVAVVLNYLRDDSSQNDSHLGRFNFWLGVLLGASVLMDYTNILFALVIGVWYLWQIRSWPKLWQRVGFLVLGGLIPGAILMSYNTINFGGPLQLSTFNVDTSRWPQNASFLHDFATPIWVGLPALLFYGSDNQGLFWLAPISILGLFGLRAFWRQSQRGFWLVVGGFVVMLLLFSTSTTFNPATNDGRYLTPFLGLWFVTVGFGIGAVLEMQPMETRHVVSPQYVAYLIVHGLFFLSLYNQILHIAYSWGHDLAPAVMRPWAAAPENIVALWKAVLPNMWNVPLWWGMLIVVWLPLHWLYTNFNRRQSGVAQPVTGD